MKVDMQLKKKIDQIKSIVTGKNIEKFTSAIIAQIIQTKIPIFVVLTWNENLKEINSLNKNRDYTNGLPDTTGKSKVI